MARPNPHDTDRAISLAYGRGSHADLDDFEDAHGCDLSDILDGLITDADVSGESGLERRLTLAYDHLTGAS
jgi:hypothetical protein